MPQERETRRSLRGSIQESLATPENRFRVWVVLANGAYFLTLILPFLEQRFFWSETIDLLRYDGYGALLVLPTSALWLISLIYLAIAMGLFHFSASARTLFVAFTLSFGVLTLFNGVRVGSPLNCFLSTVSSMGDGAILALAYSAPLREKFR
jgi:hypothetical protein